jgi:hypothetical protein
MHVNVTAEETASRIAACHESIRTFHDYWSAKKGGRAMPRRADIDPVEVKPYLPMMMLIDVTADERRFVYRLVGTAEVAERGHDPTGRPVRDAFFGGSVEETLSYYEYVVRNRAPFCYRGAYAAPDGRIETDDIIYLPLSDDGVDVNMILVYSHSYSYKRRSKPGSVT